MAARTFSPRELARAVAALRGDERKQFEAAERLTRMNASTDAENEADARKQRMGKFGGPTAASAIRPTPITWLWRGFLPLGALSLLYGPEGEGKSLMTMMLAAMATRGTLPGELEGQPANVEIVAYEDDPSAVIVPRLEAAGADLSHIYLHGDDTGDGLLTLPDDVEAFGCALEERDSKLLIIDPLPDALREGLKDNNNGDVRKGIVPLHRMAQELGVCVLGVSHPNKGATDAANKVMGSKAWRSVPRSVILFGRDPDDLNGPTRVAAVSKTNYAARTAVKLKIDAVSVATLDQDQPRAQLAGTTEYTDADLIAANAGSVSEAGASAPSQSEQAKKLLYGLLEDGGGTIDARIAYLAGAAQGLSEATMRRARREIGATGGRTWTLTGVAV